MEEERTREHHCVFGVGGGGLYSPHWWLLQRNGEAKIKKQNWGYLREITGFDFGCLVKVRV